MLITGYIENEKEVLKQLRDLQDGVLRERVFKALEKGGEKVRQEARMRAPVRAGALMDSMKIRKSPKSLSVSVVADYPNTNRFRKTKTSKQAAGSREYYAMAMEYGTKRGVRAQPFLMPAGEAKAKSIMAGIEQAMKEALRETGSTA